MNTKKIAAFTSALCMSFSIVSCSQKNPDTPDDTSDINTQVTTVSEEISGEEPEVELADNVVMNIDGYDVSEDEYKYYFAFAKYKTDGGDESYWKDDEDGAKIKSLKEKTYKYIYNAYTIYSLAESEHVKLDETDNRIIDAQIENTRKYYNAANAGMENVKVSPTFDEYLKNTCCTEEVYRETIVREHLENKVISKYFEADFRDQYFQNIARVLYINIVPEVQYVTDETGSPTDQSAEFLQISPDYTYTDAEKEEIAKLNDLSLQKNADGLKEEVPILMNIIKERLLDGESLETLIGKYNMDYSIPKSKDGSVQGDYICSDSKTEHLTSRNFRSEPFTQTAFALSEGENSDPLFIEGEGWYIIGRREFDDYYLRNYLLNIYMSDDGFRYAAQYTSNYSDVQSSMKTVYSSSYDNISYDYASVNYEIK